HTTPGDTFQPADNKVEFVGVFLGQWRDDHTGLLGVAVLQDVTLALQPVDRAAYRSTAHVETFGEFGFKDPGARGKFPVDDEFANFAKCGQKAGPMFRLRTGRADSLYL